MFSGRQSAAGTVRSTESVLARQNSSTSTATPRSWRRRAGSSGRSPPEEVPVGVRRPGSTPSPDRLVSGLVAVGVESTGRRPSGLPPSRRNPSTTSGLSPAFQTVAEKRRYLPFGERDPQAGSDRRSGSGRPVRCVPCRSTVRGGRRSRGWPGDAPAVAQNASRPRSARCARRLLRRQAERLGVLRLMVAVTVEVPGPILSG